MEGRSLPVFNQLETGIASANGFGFTQQCGVVFGEVQGIAVWL
jgi:hypothetical protein